MDNRFYKRTYLNLTARIIADGKSFEGAIENVSEGGVGYIINSSIKDSILNPRKKSKSVSLPHQAIILISNVR